MTSVRKPLEYYLSLQYPFNVVADKDGGYVVTFPDLPGCLTQVETLDELPRMADEARTLWIETAYEDSQDIPLPSYPEEYSGRFVVRMPRSLHRTLAEAAQREGVSLNQHVVSLLARGEAQAEVRGYLQQLNSHLMPSQPAAEPPRERFEMYASRMEQGDPQQSHPQRSTSRRTPKTGG